MLSKAMQDAINEQIKNELYSAYLYLAMSHHYEEMNLGGFANWLKVQFQEEQGHAFKFMEYIHERGGQVVLKALDQPPSSFGTNKEVFQQVLEHEKKVTGWIYKLYELALKENDYPTQLMLQWFINEQVEEEKNASEIIAYLDMIDAHDTAVLMLDHDLGKRKAGGD
jgi:ferritin